MVFDNNNKEKGPETLSVYISSKGVESFNKTHSLTGKSVKYIKINVNGREHEVECDKQVEIPVEIYGGVHMLLEKQAAGG